VFLFVPGRTAEPLQLDALTPPGWGWHVTTGLDALQTLHEDVPDHQYRMTPDHWKYFASDYDELVDCPVECGTHRLLHFSVDNIPHTIAIWGRGNEDERRIVTDTRRIVETERDLFGGLPYRHYTFILHLADRYGGLEHRNSVTNIVDRWSFQPQSSYERFLELQSHEFFHVWNVKRIRAAPLGPFDYRHENYTRLLWAMEGVTSYYDRLLLVRAGLMSPQRYLGRLAEEIARLQSQPGRKLHSLEESSFDAWIKLYRPDENTTNSSVSYYLKGAMAMLLLDLEIRHQTDGECSFDDVLRYLYRTYPIAGPGIPEEGAYLAAIEEVAGSAGGIYRDFFARYISGTEELDFARGLGHVGVRLEWGHSRPAHHGGVPPWLGLRLKHEHGRTLVASTHSEGPAYLAGIYPEDELLALDGLRVGRDTWQDRLSERRPGENVTVSLFRRDELRHVVVTLAPAPPDVLHLSRVESPSAQQERLYQAWLPARPVGEQQ
jgi:predicted metalloprotease with PDZ domain